METLLEIRDISVRFATGRRHVDALRHVSLEIAAGETLGLVGESGCGKSTLAKTVMGICEPSAGSILFDGQKLDLKHRKNRLAFARRAQMIFQDPFASLDPRMTVEAVIAENLEIQGGMDRAARDERVDELLAMVGLSPECKGRFPHEFSGGQCQRIGIARALAASPEFVVCDEPTSALDASVQSQIVNLLADLRERLGLSYLFIGHNIDVVRSLSDRIAVMYKGSVVELADTRELFEHPLHPYTNLLFDAVLRVDPQAHQIREPPAVSGDLPVGESGGCSFSQRCRSAEGRCFTECPELVEVARKHFVACHYVDRF